MAHRMIYDGHEYVYINGELHDNASNTVAFLSTDIADEYLFCSIPTDCGFVETVISQIHVNVIRDTEEARAQWLMHAYHAHAIS